MNKFKRDLIIEKDRAKYRRYCKCGHSIIFPKSCKSNKTICSYCGHYIFKNDKIEFEERLKSAAKKIK